MNGCTENADDRVHGLNFSEKFLWRSGEAVNVTASACLSLERFRDIVKARHDHESQTTRAFGKSFELTDEQNAIRSLYCNKAQLAQQFLRDISEDILNPIEDRLTCSRQILKELNRSQAMLEREFIDLRTRVQTLRNSLTHISSCRHAQLKRFNSGKLVDNYTEFLVDMSKLCTNYERTRYDLSAAVRVLDDFKKEKYIPSMSALLIRYQAIVESIADLVDSCTKKLLVFELSLNRGMQYELDRVVIASDSATNSLPPTVSSSPTSSSPEEFIDISQKDIFPIGLSANDCPIDLSWYDSIRESVSSTDDIDPNKIESLRSFLNTPSVRLTVLDTIASDFESPVNSIQNVGRLIWLILDECGDNDPQSVRSICVLARKIFSLSPQGSKHFLQSEIYDHKIWNRGIVWERVLTLTVAETICGIDTQTIKVEDFGTYMLMFGLSYDSAVRISRRVLDTTFEWLPSKEEMFQKFLAGLDIAAERQLRRIQVVV